MTDKTTYAPGFRLDGKVALVTGASRGIGYGLARALAEVGAQLAVSARDERALAELAATIPGSLVVPMDMRSVASINEGVARVERHFGRLDILINNAGNVRPGEIHNMPETDWDRVIQVHLKGAFAMIRYASPILCKQGDGVIINTGSESGLGHAGMANYSAAKEGIVGLTRAIARELGRFGVRCNAIRPRALTRSVQAFTGQVSRWQPLEKALGKYSLGDRGNIPTNGGPEHVAPPGCMALHGRG